MPLGEAAASPSPSTHLEFGHPRAGGTWAPIWVWGFSFLGTLRQQQARGGADFQRFHWHGGLAVLQGEENSLSIFLYRPFSTRNFLNFSFFHVPRENPYPKQQHWQLQVLLEGFQTPQGG